MNTGDKSIEILTIVYQMTQSLRIEADRINDRMMDHANYVCNSFSKISSNSIDMSDLNEAAENAGESKALTKEFDFIARQGDLLRQLMDALTGNEEGRA